MRRAWQREIRNADLQAQDQVSSRHPYGQPLGPPLSDEEYQALLREEATWWKIQDDAMDALEETES